jgi:hypothetical protein
MFFRSRVAQVCSVLAGFAWADERPYSFHPSGLPGVISNVVVEQIGEAKPLSPLCFTGYRPEINGRLVIAAPQ